MGKTNDEEQNLPGSVNGFFEQNADARFCAAVGRGCNKWIVRFIGLKCVLVLLFSLAVFLSALFWLPPFLQFANQGDLDLDSKFKGHDAVASFNLEKPVSFLQDNILQLETDIFYEISAPNIKVTILYIKQSPGFGLNSTNVIFAVDSDAKRSRIPQTSQSLIREAFELFLTRQLTLRLTTSLFGEPSFFQVLKFRGGITVTPPQRAFLLQKVQIYFNFTLNFSIYQLQENFHELTSQLKSGLHLASYENLYVSLSNSRGSTMDPPSIVQSSVFLAVGNPSMPRLKELAQTITGSHSGNLGLNNTVFGKVKQVRLSSILQHSLHGDGSPTPSPSPTPLPHYNHHRHQHHHHHHHHHNPNPAPIPSPAPETEIHRHKVHRAIPAPETISPAPAPQKSHKANPPGCQTGHKRGYTGKSRKHFHTAPASEPSMSPPHRTALSPPHRTALSPRHVGPPTLPPAHAPPSVPLTSPLPSVAFSHAQPPSESKSDNEHAEASSPLSPSPTPSSADLPAVQWALSLFLAVLLLLQ